MEQIIEQRSEEWRKQRHGKFSASEIYKLMGKASLGKTGKSYAIDKAIEQLYGEVDENFVSYDMERGIELEPLAFAKFKELMSLQFIEVENCGFFNLLNDAGASPDGLVGNKAVLEIKCPKPSTHDDALDNRIPEYYLDQIQHQLLVSKCDMAFYFSYRPERTDKPYAVIEVYPDRIKQEQIIKLGYEFYQNMQTMNPPVEWKFKPREK